MAKEFDGKVALITGGSRGIGKAIAVKLAQRGANTVITFFKSRDKAEETAKEIEKLGVQCLTLRNNIKDRGSVVKMFEKVKEQFGVLDILVFNAAMGFFSETKDFPEDKWDITVEANATSYLLCAKESAKLMKNGGKIVGMSSYGSKRFIPGYSAMGASKAVIETLTRYLAVELADLNINVNCVSGGPVETDSLKMIPDFDKLVEESVKRTPVKRIGQPDDIAAVVSFLCSDDSNWVRGQIIVADGGMSLL